MNYFNNNTYYNNTNNNSLSFVFSACRVVCVCFGVWRVYMMSVMTLILILHTLPFLNWCKIRAFLFFTQKPAFNTDTASNSDWPEHPRHVWRASVSGPMESVHTHKCPHLKASLKVNFEFWVLIWHEHALYSELSKLDVLSVKVCQ